MRKLSRLALSAPLASASLFLAAATPALAAPHHGHRTAQLPQMPPSMAHALNNPPEKHLTPAQQSALPDEGAPPPPHGYTEVEDSETHLSSFSSTARTHLPLGMPETNPTQTVGRANNLPSHLSLFGVPVKFNAPVIAPYHDENQPLSYAGQPDVRAAFTANASGSATP